LLAGGLLFLASPTGCAQGVVATAPCCGPITAEGRRLAGVLDSMEVEARWQKGWHVDWRTGLPDRPGPGGRAAATHCSAFAAAVADRLGIYLLRPPEHPQELLASAQLGWLASPAGAAAGWRSVGGPVAAQELANYGVLVLAVVAGRDRRRPGHVAVLRPSLKDEAALDRDGPQVAQAGETNHASTTMEAGFRHHAGAWLPGGAGTARFYAHAVSWATVAPPG
jgi:hypothetical protein